MDLRLNKGIEEIYLVKTDDSGRRTIQTIYRPNKKRKKSTGPVGPLGKVVRKLVASQQAALGVYLAKHDESNQKKSDGWVRDLPYNVYRATRRGLKQVRRATGLPSLGGDD